MKNNSELQKDVQDAIKWEPLLNAAEIGVTVKDGIVTLTGVVDSYAKKSEAESAAKSVAGVKVVVEKIEIKFSSIYGKKDDNEIAAEVLRAFKWNWRIPEDGVKVKVENGWVTLEGELQWDYQKDGAKDAVKNLLGVIGVSNNIKVKSDLRDATEKSDIEMALKRSWAFSNDEIGVEVYDHRASLTGTVASLYQKEEAGRIALNAPGVWAVNNELVVDYDYALMGL
jgi:osmotically-inducible protein OsmY